MSRLNKHLEKKYIPLLKLLAPDTGFSGNPKLYFQSLMMKKGVATIIGCLPSFGFDRYYNVEDQADVDRLVRACQNGGSMEVKWYYLSKEDI